MDNETALTRLLSYSHSRPPDRPPAERGVVQQQQARSLRQTEHGSVQPGGHGQHHLPEPHPQN